MENGNKLAKTAKGGVGQVEGWSAAKKEGKKVVNKVDKGP
jgi:hypothetical protein